MTTRQDDIERLIEIEARLKNYHGEDEIIISNEMLDLLHAKLGETHPFELIPGFIGLDFSIRHFLGGELIVISGPTKHGKTLLAQTFTRNFSNQDHMGLWLTYEVPAHQFLQQFGDQLPVFSMPKTLKDNSLSWIIERVHEATLKHHIRYVFIDNTHNVINLTSNNLSQVMGEFLKGVKKMAMRFNVAVFLLHHMTKIKLTSDEEKDNGFDSSFLRDSSLVAQTADTVMFVWRDKDTILKPNHSYVKVTENRRYGIMNHIVPLIKIGNFLEEREVL